MSLGITEEIIARQPPEAQAIIRLLLVNQPVQVAVSRDDVSEGQYIVRRLLFPRGEFSSDCVELESSAWRYEFVASTPGAIGCRLFRPEREGRSEKGVRTLRIVRDGRPPVEPTQRTIANDEYPLQASVVAIARRDDDIARQFVHFLRSEHADKAIIQTGILPYSTLAAEESR